MADEIIYTAHEPLSDKEAYRQRTRIGFMITRLTNEVVTDTYECLPRPPVKVILDVQHRALGPRRKIRDNRLEL